MSINSSIEWTQATWNPITGCTPISMGCDNCYAMRLAHRLQKMGNKNYANGFKLTLHEDMLQKPLTWKKPQIVFVNSMSDIFHESVPLDFIIKIFETMKKAYWHTFQILTKRSTRLKELGPKLIWPNNVWMGVTVESQKYAYRIDNLRTVPSSIRFLSLEPLLSPISPLNLENIDWVIVGGESGPKARPIEKQWVENILFECRKSNIPFFFKQWGGKNKKRNGRLLHGKVYAEYPSAFRQKFLT